MLTSEPVLLPCGFELTAIAEDMRSAFDTMKKRTPAKTTLN
jgi:hypothetical protein